MDEKFPVDVLISGQALTSRTETIEDYLRPRVPRLGVIALASPFATSNVARSVEYRDGVQVRGWPVPSVLVGRRDTVLGAFRLAAAFANYYRVIGECARNMGWPFDLFIGVSCFSAFAGIGLRRRGLVRKHVYYSIDYYPPPPRFGFNRFMVAAFRAMDRYCARHSDMVWHITPRIAEARERMGGVGPGCYPHIEVPLSYRASLQRFPDDSAVERWTIGFVGTLTETQGVQLLVDAMPALLKRFPDLKVRLVGHGPYAEALRRLVAERGLADRFIFHGFIKDEDEMLDVISRCAVAVAPWTQSEDNNILYADPGKPKLYMCLGVPCVITRGPDIARTIESAGAGLAVEYERTALEEALTKVLSDDSKWRGMRRRAAALGEGFTSEKLLSAAVRETLGRIGPAAFARESGSSA